MISEKAVNPHSVKKRSINMVQYEHNMCKADILHLQYCILSESVSVRRRNHELQNRATIRLEGKELQL